jgi:hypothetical protein
MEHTSPGASSLSPMEHTSSLLLSVSLYLSISLLPSLSLFSLSLSLSPSSLSLPPSFSPSLPRSLAPYLPISLSPSLPPPSTSLSAHLEYLISRPACPCHNRAETAAPRPYPPRGPAATPWCHRAHDSDTGWRPLRSRRRLETTARDSGSIVFNTLRAHDSDFGTVQSTDGNAGHTTNSSSQVPINQWGLRPVWAAPQTALIGGSGWKGSLDAMQRLLPESRCAYKRWTSRRGNGSGCCGPATAAIILRRQSTRMLCSASAPP